MGSGRHDWQHPRPDTTRSFQEPAKHDAPDPGDTVNFVGLVLCSVHQFRLAVQVDPEAAEEFSMFYQKYWRSVGTGRLPARPTARACSRFPKTGLSS
jgi:hypothetical protein